MASVQRITPCLWFDDQAEDAARFYTGIFPNSRITAVTRYSEVGEEIHGRPAGSVMVVAFELDGHAFTGLNGGPIFRFNEAVSFQVMCDDQAEVDRLWSAIEGNGGQPMACSWIKDRWGLAWQIVPRVMLEMLSSEDRAAAERAMLAMMDMVKLDIAKLERAYRGG